MADMQVADTLIGALINGRYRVRDRLARGGMATVYTAVDQRLERTVALKIIHPGQASELPFVDRFVDEARAIARLTHPNVVAAYDQGTHEGLPYLVMEYVRGRTLREVLRTRRRLTPVEALAITEQMLAAIAAAHRAGLVHRDIKPENVLVAEAPSGGGTNLIDSVVKVTDFGLAQAVQASGGEAAGGALLATVAYVAPELVAEGRADPRSDVYSTGIVLFEMLTGEVPYDGAEPAEVAWRHVDEEVPPPSQLLAGLPPAVDQLVLRATRRDRSARPSDAGALLQQVQAAREQVTASATPPRPTDATAPADATMVISKVPGTERPTWARLPDTRGTRSAGSRRATTRQPARRQLRQGGNPSLRRAGRRPPTTLLGHQLTPQQQRILIFSLVGVLALLLSGGGWWWGFGRWQPAPELVGMSQAEALVLAQQQGLQVTYGDPAYHDDIPAEHVLSQDPAGRVVKGGTLTLTLSLGPEVYPVPDVVGADIEVATRQLEALRLVVVLSEPRYSDTVPEGRVLSIEPLIGELVVPGDEVTITVSQGRAPIDVPSVIGLPVDQAQEQLAQRELVAQVEEVESDAPQGEVVGQDPSADSGAEPGATVTLQVSKGPPTQPVPDVTDERCRRAERTLTEAGFVVLRIGEGGRVILQNPSAGTGLPPGGEVTILCA